MFFLLPEVIPEACLLTYPTSCSEKHNQSQIKTKRKRQKPPNCKKKKAHKNHEVHFVLVKYS